MITNINDYVTKKKAISSKNKFDNMMLLRYIENCLKMQNQLSISVPDMSAELYALISPQKSSLDYDDLEYIDISTLVDLEIYLKYLVSGYKKVACIYYDKDIKKFVGMVVEGVPSYPTMDVKYREVADIKCESDDLKMCFIDLGNQMQKFIVRRKK